MQQRDCLKGRWDGGVKEEKVLEFSQSLDVCFSGIPCVKWEGSTTESPGRQPLYTKPNKVNYPNGALKQC